jgi:hypothetical protein
MSCDEILIRAAELEDPVDPEVEGHLAVCSACRAVVDAARDGRDALSAFERAEEDSPWPPADAAAAWRSARRGPGRLLRGVARAAVLLLAAGGAFALAGIDLRARPTVSAATPADVEAAVARLSARIDARDRARAGETREIADWLDVRRREDVDVLVEEIVSLRRELVALRLEQRSFLETAAPALPDPR